MVQNQNQNQNLQNLEFWVNTQLSIEKIRIATQIRNTHLKKQGRTDENTEKLLEHLKSVEKFVDNTVANMIKSHPAYYWFSKVKGVGKENIGKVIGQLKMINSENKDVAPHISSFWQFAGFGMEKDGTIQKRKKGQKTSYNITLKTMVWRLTKSLIRAKGKFYDYYKNQKDVYVERFKNQGYKIVPSSELPEKSGKKYEPEGVISVGHIEKMAFRKTAKLFLACLWLTWREAERLPLTKPYAIEKLEHSHMLDPWDFADKK